MALTLKIINEELAKRGHTARLAQGTGYFYFYGGEAKAWLDQTVKVAKVNHLTLEEWMSNFDRLKTLNERIMSSSKSPSRTTSRK